MPVFFQAGQFSARLQRRRPSDDSTGRSGGIDGSSGAQLQACAEREESGTGGGRHECRLAARLQSHALGHQVLLSLLQLLQLIGARVEERLSHACHRLQNALRVTQAGDQTLGLECDGTAVVVERLQIIRDILLELNQVSLDIHHGVRQASCLGPCSVTSHVGGDGGLGSGNLGQGTVDGFSEAVGLGHGHQRLVRLQHCGLRLIDQVDGHLE
mmetsp:Transcript_43444/g.116669  ORF Transcript_43444/g.116669 Transcript_43444/m.116669 type:complete len:213 (-) Transcript_43444:1807-2445(-)